MDRWLAWVFRAPRAALGIGLASGLVAMAQGCGSTVLVNDCAEGQSICDGSCADLSSDPEHCGDCGESCAEGEVCIGGGCTFEPPPPSCDAPLTVCDGECVDPRSDPNHCGGCTVVCDGACDDSSCQPSTCKPGQIACDGGCFDPLNDPFHCGDCVTVCFLDDICSGGECAGVTCEPGLELCFGACVDTNSDPNNCGFCGNGCGPGATCENKSCQAVGCDNPVCGVCQQSSLPPTNSFTIVGTTSVGSDDRDPSCTGPTGGREVLWQFTASETGHYLFDTTGSSYDTVLEALTPGCASLGCNDDFNGANAHLEIDLMAGQTIYLVVDGFGDGDYKLDGTSGCFPGLTLCGATCSDTTSDPNNCGFCGNVCGPGSSCVNSFCTPPAPTCPTATLPSNVPQSLSGVTSGGPDTMQGICAPSNGPEHTYAFTPPTTGIYTIDTQGSSYDTVLYIMSGSCAGQQIACNDDNGGLSSQLVVNLVAGQPYTIVVDGWGAANGTYNLHIQ